METEKPLTGEATPQEASAVPQSSESQQNQAEPPQLPDPTHEAYLFDKATGKKQVVAQGQEFEIKRLLKMNRRPGFWLYMRPIPEQTIEELNREMLERTIQEDAAGRDKDICAQCGTVRYSGQHSDPNPDSHQFVEVTNGSQSKQE